MALNTGVLGGFNYQHVILAAPTTTVVKASEGILHLITINNPQATGVIIIYDGLSAAGNPIGAIVVPATPQPVSLFYDIHFTVGLTLVTQTASCDLTVALV